MNEDTTYPLYKSAIFSLATTFGNVKFNWIASPIIHADLALQSISVLLLLKKGKGKETPLQD